jgi:hypothetical protein
MNPATDDHNPGTRTMNDDILDSEMLRTILYGPRPMPILHPEIASLRRRLDTEPNWKPDVSTLLHYFHTYCDQPGNAVGGVLRPFLSYNHKDNDIIADRDDAIRIGDIDGVTLCDALLRMSRTQRRKVSRRFRY